MIEDERLDEDLGKFMMSLTDVNVANWIGPFERQRRRIKASSTQTVTCALHLLILSLPPTSPPRDEDQLSRPRWIIPRTAIQRGHAEKGTEKSLWIGRPSSSFPPRVSTSPFTSSRWQT